jgi:hypothetical protein
MNDEIDANNVKEIFECFEGKLRWKVQPSVTIKIGGVVGSIGSTGYLQVRYRGKYYKVHRLIWMYHFGEIPEGLVVDHVDTDRLNNAITNLRLATVRQNTRNSKKHKTLTSVYKGVYWSAGHNAWRACIKVEGHTKVLGRFDTEIAAYAAYCIAAKDLHGEFFNPG